SQQKKMTALSQALRFMRKSRGISQKEAALRCKLSEQSIGHYEHGRMGISEARLSQFLSAYGFTRAELDEYLSGKPIPVVSLKEECTDLLAHLDAPKLH